MGDAETSEGWAEIILYHCGRRMKVDRSLPLEQDDLGKWWRHRYWRCANPHCGFRDQTRDEVPEPTAGERTLMAGRAKPRPESGGGSRLAELGRFRRR